MRLAEERGMKYVEVHIEVNKEAQRRVSGKHLESAEKHLESAERNRQKLAKELQRLGSVDKLDSQ